MIHLDYRDARPIYCQITDGFREQISAGILQNGDKLPSVRELAASLAINPNTIQRSYRELEMQGWIVTVPGKGCFVCADPGGEDSRRLLEDFDRACAALLRSGYSRQELIQRLGEEGNDHA